MSASALDRLNVLPEQEAERELLACCASTTWAARVLEDRPFETPEQLLEVAERACRELTPADVEQALAGHPRIGERAEGVSREAGWSRQEQASVSDADAEVTQQLHAGNVAYEQRFGRVFLIRAAGRTPAQMLSELQRRLDSPPEVEQREVVEQLAQITRLRVAKLLGG